MTMDNNRMERTPETDRYGDGDVPEVDTLPYTGSRPEIDTERYQNGAQVEPLPESFRERRDGPGGN
ncbi:MAG: hypothetical protein Q4F29_05870 [Lachnospiraceae bacterium]|nr:hypothetical protein [Lachnospiraceae bacterium]